MPLQNHPDFGPLYLDPNAFVSAAAMFGVEKALPDDLGLIQSFLASASRWIEAQTGKVYVPELDTVEQHRWDPVTRRITVNNPPVLSVSSYKVFTGADTFATFQSNTLVINNQENYVELTAMAAVGNLTPGLLTLGLTEPFVEITYKSFNSVKFNIKLATGYVAARMMNSALVEGQIPFGIKSIKIGSSAQITRNEPETGFYQNQLALANMPAEVHILLSGERTIGVA